MEMLVSSFYTVTQEVEDLIKSWEKKGLDYTLVMTDASNPFISSARREEFLEKTLGKKAVEVKHLMWNEYSEEEFINSIEAIIEEEKIKDLYFQTYVPKEDFDPMSLKENCTLHVLNAPKGDILDNLNSYLKVLIHGLDVVQIVSNNWFQWSLYLNTQLRTLV